jgi:hypothetical protein
LRIQSHDINIFHNLNYFFTNTYRAFGTFVSEERKRALPFSIQRHYALQSINCEKVLFVLTGHGVD